MANLQTQEQAPPVIPPAAVRKMTLCEHLVASGKLEQSNADRALHLQREQAEWERIGSVLVKLGLVSEHDVAHGLSQQLDIRLVSKVEFPLKLDALTKISPRFLKKIKALILEEDDNSLSLVMADPGDEYALQAFALCSGKSINASLGVPSEIEIALQQLFDQERPAEDTAGTEDMSMQFNDDVERLKELAGEAPIIKLVNQLLHNAADAGASDIHIEPFEDLLKIRYRIDGLLREIDTPPTRSSAAVISRIKIMANMNIAERRLAQDGRFKHRVRGKEFDLRVSTVPTMYGESVVLRLLQRDGISLDFGPLGFSPEQEQSMHDLLALPHGILLVTGPTGSGKTTTLYAALQHLNQPERKIITVEDPVEYNIQGINQIQVKPQIDLTFATALRSIVRQDPDVIMVGEMRDTETAQIAVQSALTGHLVLSTLHTNDAAGSIMRLLDMGIEDYLLTSAVNAVQAQRLVRTLCPACRESYAPVDEIAERWQLQRFATGEEIRLYRTVGCKKCGDTGYSGRSAILEILVMSNEIKEMILKRPDASRIARTAINSGMVTMRDDGLSKASAGITTLEEVLRVTPGQANGHVPL